LPAEVVAPASRAVAGSGRRPAGAGARSVRARQRGEGLAGVLFVLPATLLMVAVLVFPALVTLRLSLSPREGAGTWTFTLSQYGRLLHDPVLAHALWNTVTFVATSLAGHLLLGLALALALSQRLPGLFVLRLIVLVPWTVPDVVAGILFRWIFNPISGCLNPLLHAIFPRFPENFAWLSSPALAFPSVIFANVWRGYPLVMVILLAGLVAIPRELYEAAAVDGAGHFRRFVHVTLPGLSTLIVIAMALDMVWEFRRFALVLTMTGGGPGTLTEVLSTLVYKTYFQFFTFEYASAIAIVMSVFLFALSMPYIALVARER
jgi:multiple sugar transport system permease protein